MNSLDMGIGVSGIDCVKNPMDGIFSKRLGALQEVMRE